MWLGLLFSVVINLLLLMTHGPWSKEGRRHSYASASFVRKIMVGFHHSKEAVWA